MSAKANCSLVGEDESRVCGQLAEGSSNMSGIEESSLETGNWYEVMSHLDVNAAKNSHSPPSKWLYHVVLRKLNAVPGQSETFTYEQGANLFPAALEKYLQRTADRLRVQMEALIREQKEDDAEAASIVYSIDLLSQICRNPVGFGALQEMFLNCSDDVSWEDTMITSLLQNIVDKESPEP